jgi:hypothetical protein
MQGRFVSPRLHLTLGLLLVAGSVVSLFLFDGPEAASLAAGFFGLVLTAFGIYGTSSQKPVANSPSDNGSLDNSTNTNVNMSSNHTFTSHTNIRDNHGGVILGVVAIVALVVIVGVIGFAVISTQAGETEDNAKSAAAEESPVTEANPNRVTCGQPVPLAGETLRAQSVTVVYTQGEGVLARCGPSIFYPQSDQQDLFDNVHVNIVCQVRDGYPVQDRQNVEFPDGYPRESTVWNLLHDGRWVSDLFVDTPKVEGDVPPDGYELCGGLVPPV